jgi:predicted  nucleic acid-binding Zn-ribbon protein
LFLQTLQNEIVNLKNRIQKLELQLTQEIDSHNKTKEEFQGYRNKAKNIVNHLQTSGT